SSDQKVADIDGQLSVLKEVDSYVRSKGGSGTPSTVGLGDPALSMLISKLAEAETRYQSMKLTTGENNPMTLQ
ncbi:MAG: hypothetical protein J7497_17350, partial [Chitinophagaceae bacterium]|nr:hypothetical protein [Chitinophagaceae bacterium]